MNCRMSVHFLIFSFTVVLLGIRSFAFANSKIPFSLNEKDSQVHSNEEAYFYNLLLNQRRFLLDVEPRNLKPREKMAVEPKLYSPQKINPRILQSSGTESGGGGSVIRFNGQAQFFLLDRISLNPNLPSVSDPTPHIFAKSVLQLDPDKKLSIIKAADLAAFKIATLILSTYSNGRGLLPDSQTTTGFIELVEVALENMAFLKTDSYFATLPRYDLNVGFQEMNPEVIMPILYISEFGAIISVPIWNELDVFTQAGLLIHEAIRQIQGAYQFKDLPDLNLQVLTAIILTQDSSQYDISSWLPGSLQKISKARGEMSLALRRKIEIPTTTEAALRLLKSMRDANQLQMNQWLIGAEQRARSQKIALDQRSGIELSELLYRLVEEIILKPD